MKPRTVRTLGIYLGSHEVGFLSWFSDGRSIFQFSEDYQTAGPQRPILSLSFVVPGDEGRTREKLAASYTRTVRLQSFFRNLLPEGALRVLMSRKLGIAEADEIGLLEGLGGNLPGAVVAERQRTPGRLADEAIAHPAAIEGDTASTVFSLGGAQLKFSLFQSGARFTTKAGESANSSEWIVKPPHPTFPEVPRNEYETLRLAAAIGINVPAAKLVSLKDLDLKEDSAAVAPRGENVAYAIQRFDRSESHDRIHIEDFAQVFGVEPEEEYSATNYDTVANLIFNVFPDQYAQLEEFIRRLVFMVLVGNSDAHLKNWSVIYFDGITPSLSPAYDLVSTIHFVPSNRTLALNIRREREFGRLGRDHFARMAKRIGVGHDLALRVVDETIDRANTEWKRQLRDVPKALRETLRQHWKSLQPEFRITA